MNVRSKILKIRNLPTDGKLVDHINAKPYLFILCCICAGVFLLFTRFYLIGIIITFLFLYYLLFVKDITLIEFYDKYAVFYLNNGKEECFLLFWEDVEKWDISGNRNDLDILNIVLRNRESIALKCLGRKKVARYFKAYVPSPCEENTIGKQHAL